MNDQPIAVAICPFCGSRDTDMLALFGQQLMTVQYYCNGCRTPFERVKSRDVLMDAWAHEHTRSAADDDDHHADRT